jgi:diguanylate cyclase (GGDEF)-like protein
MTELIHMNDTTEIKKLYASIGKLITSSLELDGIVAGIMEEIRIFFNPDNWSLLRYDHTTEYLYFLYARGINIEKVKNVRIKSGEGIAGTVARSGESQFVPDTSVDPRFTDKIDRITGFQTHSLIAVPLIFRGQVYGVIELVNRSQGGSFTEDEHLLLGTIADFAAIALANSNLYDEIKHMSVTDSLTGVFNRNRLDQVLHEFNMTHHHRREIDRSSSFITLVFLDLDNFKEINDRLGHAKGDGILKEFARNLRSIAREDDMIFRIGGDEFLILSAYSSEEIVQEIEERMKSELSRIDNIDFSYGISSGRMADVDNLLQLADRSMYHFKKRD